MRCRDWANVVGTEEERRAPGLRFRLARPDYDPMVIDEYGSRPVGMINPDDRANVRVRVERGIESAIRSGPAGHQVGSGREAVSCQHMQMGSNALARVVMGDVVVRAQWWIGADVIGVETVSSHRP